MYVFFSLFVGFFFQVKIYSFRLISYGLVVPACRHAEKKAAKRYK